MSVINRLQISAVNNIEHAATHLANDSFATGTRNHREEALTRVSEAKTILIASIANNTISGEVFLDLAQHRLGVYLRLQGML